MEKQLFPWAATPGLGKYCMGGNDRIEIIPIGTNHPPLIMTCLILEYHIDMTHKVQFLVLWSISNSYHSIDLVHCCAFYHY